VLTLVPDLVAIWKIQAQLVADIAGARGRSGSLTSEQMLYCLFRHAASQLLRDVVVRAGAVRSWHRLTVSTLQDARQAPRREVSRQLIAKTASRWIPGSAPRRSPRMHGGTPIASPGQPTSCSARARSSTTRTPEATTRCHRARGARDRHAAAPRPVRARPALLVRASCPPPREGRADAAAPRRHERRHCCARTRSS
jgi:hypothetical protein